MVMDKGMGLDDVRNFLSVAAPYVDIAKLGFGTAAVTNNLHEKIEIYKSFNVPVYFGGTLFEAFLIRNQFDDYVSVVKEHGLEFVEVSDGSINITHAEKCGYIEKMSKYVRVLSEVGSKDATHIIPPYKWIALMKAELEAGSELVIADAREAGNVGIYRGSGEVREGLVQVLKSCKSKEEQKAVLRKLGVEKARLIIDYAIPSEDYEICQVAKEVVEELEGA